MSNFNILEWWNNLQPLSVYDKEKIEMTRNGNTTNNVKRDNFMFCYLYNDLFKKMPFSGLDFSEYDITVDDCASNLINKLFNQYVDDDTLVISSNAEHETVVKNLGKCKNTLILDQDKDIRGYNFNKIMSEVKKFKKVFIYIIGTQISTGEISPQTFFVELKELLKNNYIEHIMVLDAVQEMFLYPRNYRIFDYIIGTGHAICGNYDLGLLIGLHNALVKGYYDYEPLFYYNKILDVILNRKDKLNIFSNVLYEYYKPLLNRPEFSRVDNSVPYICSIKSTSVDFNEEIKELLDKYEIRIEGIGNSCQFIRFRAQMFIKSPELLLKGIEILNDYIKEQIG